MIMARFDKTIKPSAAVPRRKSSLGRRDKSNSSIHETIPLHRTRHLIVTTTKGVFTWGNHGVKEIFTSGSGGIVAARRLKNGSSLLAVADSQVVVLHDTRKGMQKSYKLRGSDGQVRLLRYAGDSKSLFFTTTLQNAVQTYSLKESKLLDPSYNHPSPPTVFAISPNFHFLLSASVSPPTIHLTNISLNTPPIVIHPQCSSSAVVTAEFHPKSPTVFLMAFADGACATYDAARLFRDGGRGERRAGPAASGATAETTFIKNVHTMNNRQSVITSGSSTEPDGFNVGVGDARVGSKYVGITAAGFIPGYKRRFLTVGSDGNCCVIDHEGPGKKEAYVVNSWNIQGPATSLSIALFQPDFGVFGQNDIRRPLNAGSARKGKVIIAVGRQDGYVLLYDLHGTQLSKRRFHAEASRIVDVEWMNGEESNELRRGELGNISPQTLFARGARKSTGSMLAKGQSETLPVTDCIDLPLDIPTRNSSIKEKNRKEDTIERERIHEGDKNAKREKANIDALNQHYLAVTALNHLDIFSPEKPHEPKRTVERSQCEPPQESDDSEATVKAKRIYSLSPSTQDAPEKELAPSIPPRPVSKRNHAATAQAQAASLNGGKAADTEAQPIDRRAAAGPGKGLSLFAPYMKPNVIAVPLAVSGTKPQNSSNDTANHNAALEEDIWTDVSPPPTRAPSKRNRSQHKSSSEASNNTIIDWTAASARPPNALVPHPPLISPNKPSKKVRKGHISISPSVISEDLPIQWSTFKQPPIFSIREDHRKTESFHPSPKDLSRPASYLAMPLTEASPNPKSAKPSLSLLSYSVKEELGQLQSELTKQLQSVMQSEVRDMKDEMMRQFMEQKRWIEVKMEEWRDREKLLEDETRGLRGQLAKERRWKIGGMRG